MINFKLSYPYYFTFNYGKTGARTLWDFNTCLRIKGDHKGFISYVSILWFFVELEIVSCLHEEDEKKRKKKK